ncbi:hypothetical protein CXB51_010774 [Gossypium anomalum]|uniref:Peptidase A1 domain-containing protein n=1 Tax=Gossypium anomalum TaxID=47600 RepID=A0A8J6D4N6_9ROSI|nr:hypothetical protein CXB51_010774 [Gossypium anomalum]
MGRRCASNTSQGGKDQARLQYLSSLVAKKPVVPIASGRQIVQSPTYIVRASIGTPPQTLLMAWILAVMPLGYLALAALAALLLSLTMLNPPLSNPSAAKVLNASRFAPNVEIQNPSCDGSGNTCIFNMTYWGSTIAANLSQDTFTLANDPVSSYTFGCLQKTTGNSVPPQGLLGLGRGPLSLLSQTQDLYQSTFSYCLPNVRSANFSGSLRLGPIGQPVRIKYTQLLMNPRRPSLYFVNLIGIRAGNKVVDIPPSAIAFNPTTGAGTIIDSGIVFTQLVEPTYVANVTSIGGFNTCYTVPIVAPRITFMFASMNVTLPQDNLLIHSTAGSITCLAMVSALDNVNSVLNLIANMQQQNHRILFDVPNSRLGITCELCT